MTEILVSTEEETQKNLLFILHAWAQTKNPLHHRHNLACHPVTRGITLPPKQYEGAGIVSIARGNA